MFGLQIVTGEYLYLSAKGLCLLAFLADVLALARAERGKKPVKVLKARVVSVELLAFAGQQAQLLCGGGLVLGTKGNVQGRQPV